MTATGLVKSRVAAAFSSSAWQAERVYVGTSVVG